MSRWFSNLPWVKLGLWSCGQKCLRRGQDFLMKITKYCWHGVFILHDLSRIKTQTLKSGLKILFSLPSQWQFHGAVGGVCTLEVSQLCWGHEALFQRDIPVIPFPGWEFQWSHCQSATGKSGVGGKSPCPGQGVPGVLCRARLLCKQLHCCGAYFN